MKKLICLLLLAVTLFSFASCSRRPEDFKAADMTITLTRDFDPSPLPGFTACYHSKRVMVMIMKEPFSIKEGFRHMTLAEYAQSVRANNESKNPSEVKEEDGLTYFSYVYSDAERGKTYVYLCFTYKSIDGFWLVQFATPEKHADKYRDDIFGWAKSVRFGD